MIVLGDKVLDTPLFSGSELVHRTAYDTSCDIIQEG